MQKTIVVWLGALICCTLWEVRILHQDRIRDVCGRGGGCRIADSVCRMPVFARGRAFHSARERSGQKDIDSEENIMGKSADSLHDADGTAISVFLHRTTRSKGVDHRGVNVFCAILVASLLFHQETLNGRKIIGSIIGFAGVVLVNLTGGGVDLGFSFLGEGFIFLSAVAYAFPLPV